VFSNGEDEAPSAAGNAFVIVSLASCDGHPTRHSADTTTTATSTASALLRAASFAFDARTVDVVVDGAGGQQTFMSLAYPGVSDYLELGPGDYRVQFFPVGSRRATLAETSVTLSPDEAVTVALVGLSALEIVVFEDDPIDSSSSAGVTMANAIPDFPAPLDGLVLNGPTLFRDVDYLQTSEPSELIPGLRYPVRRGPVPVLPLDRATSPLERTTLFSPWAA
jgi:hypothetical protein